MLPVTSVGLSCICSSNNNHKLLFFQNWLGLQQQTLTKTLENNVQVKKKKVQNVNQNDPIQHSISIKCHNLKKHFIFAPRGKTRPVESISAADHAAVRSSATFTRNPFFLPIFPLQTPPAVASSTFSHNRNLPHACYQPTSGRSKTLGKAAEYALDDVTLQMVPTCYSEHIYSQTEVWNYALDDDTVLL